MSLKAFIVGAVVVFVLFFLAPYLIARHELNRAGLVN